MRRAVTILVLVATIFFMFSCNSMESDAKKLAKRAYEIEKVYESLNDRSNIHGSRASKEAKIKDYTKYANKMFEKHGKTRKEREQFNKLVNKELTKLKKK
jgi:hypothetical protein